MPNKVLTFIVPTLQRGNSSGNALALRDYEDAGASTAAFQRWSVGTM